MAPTRPPKKSETLEIRLPHATKMAFMDRCRDEGRTASDAMRGFIEGQLTGRGAGRGRSVWWQAAAAAMAGLAIGAVAAPSVAQTRPLDRAAFDRMDRDGDGVLVFDEFQRR